MSYLNLSPLLDPNGWEGAQRGANSRGKQHKTAREVDSLHLTRSHACRDNDRTPPAKRQPSVRQPGNTALPRQPRHPLHLHPSTAPLRPTGTYPRSHAVPRPSFTLVNAWGCEDLPGPTTASYFKHQTTVLSSVLSSLLLSLLLQASGNDYSFCFTCCFLCYRCLFVWGFLFYLFCS